MIQSSIAWVDVAAAVIVRDGCVLACQRSFAGRHPGKFEFPGGKVEPGESLSQCLARELDEELGIVTTIGSLLWQTEHLYPGSAPVRLSFFAIEAYSGEIANRVFASLCWQPIATLEQLDFLEADRDFVRWLAARSEPLPSVRLE